MIAGAPAPAAWRRPSPGELAGTAYRAIVATLVLATVTGDGLARDTATAARHAGWVGGVGVAMVLGRHRLAAAIRRLPVPLQFVVPSLLIAVAGAVALGVDPLPSAALIALAALVARRVAPAGLALGFGAVATLLQAPPVAAVPGSILAYALMVWVPARAARAPAPIGAKARRLEALRALGLAVPPFFVIPAGHTLDPAALRAAVQRLGPPGTPLAVRSSAEAEDTPERSYAGRYKTVLNATDVAEAARAVVDSASPRPGSAEVPTAMAVIVQRLVQAEVSGVAFGVHPVSGDPAVRVIEATWGLGEGVVNGSCAADRFTLRGAHVEPALADKTTRVVPGPGGGTTHEEVPEALRGGPVLSEARIQELGAILERLAVVFGGPQDVEFAVAEGRLWLLQTRPVTGLRPRVWDNHNLADSYPGLVTPLTASFVRRAYEVGNRNLAEQLAIPRRELTALAEPLANLVGTVRGRLYYDLTNLRAVLHVLPFGAAWSRLYDETIGAPPSPDHTPAAPLPLDLWRGVRTGAALAIGLLRLPRAREQFHCELEAILAGVEGRDLDDLDAAGVAGVYRELEGRVFARWSAPPLNGFLAMVFFGGLRRLARRLEWPPELLADLVGGQGGVVSAEAAEAVAALAAAVRGEPELAGRIASAHEDVAWEALATHPRLSDPVADFLRRFGDRAPAGELVLENPTWRDRPDVLIRAVRAQLGAARTRSAAARRAAAEVELARRLAGMVLRRPIWWWLARTRALVAWRETFRSARTRAFAQARRAFRALGRALARTGSLSRPDDLFWLGRDEVLALAGAELDPAEARRRIAGRRAAWAAWEGEELPARIVHRGPPDGYAPAGVVAQVRSDGQKIVGVGCCAGRAEGPVRVVRTQEDLAGLRPGEVIVAMNADPGWVFWFPAAAGVVLERGSLLGHVAIATRELGVPCVIGATGALALVRAGDRVVLDGGTGEVRLVRT